MSDDKKEAFLRGQQPRKQIELYLAALWRRHPPNSGLAFVLAEQGERILPYLLESLSETTDRRAKLDLLDIITLMQRRSYYCVTCDPDAVEKIGKQLDELGYEPLHKQVFLEWLQSEENANANR